ncbi:MAG: UDP-glucose/GDP-mannose dehydrogenase family protein, partial [Pontibacterium sp.]
MKIVVYGTNVSAMGAAALLARAGNDVSMQLSPQDIATRRISVDEPALKALLQEQFEAGRLSSFDTNYPPADAELHWLCLETNELERAKRIVTQADSRHEDKLLIVNQTIFGIGATDQLNDILGNQEQRAVVYLPDSLRGGQIVDSFLKPDQLVIGSSSRWATGRVIAMARVLMSTVPRIRTMSAQEAEFSSLALNGLLAMRLSYINEMANLADSVGIDIETVRETMSGDARIGPHFLKPGCGFGGQKFSG